VTVNVICCGLSDLFITVNVDPSYLPDVNRPKLITFESSSIICDSSVGDVLFSLRDSSRVKERWQGSSRSSSSIGSVKGASDLVGLSRSGR
jgi:hypothetical protein